MVNVGFQVGKYICAGFCISAIASRKFTVVVFSVFFSKWLLYFQSSHIMLPVNSSISIYFPVGIQKADLQRYRDSLSYSIGGTSDQLPE